jgi:fluoride exporter
VTLLLVLAGGLIGAPARYLADRALQARHDTVFPWGTFAVNVSGCLLLGFLLGAQRHLGLPAAVLALLGTGFCGGLTTFSTFGYETLRLLEDGAISEAGMNVAGSLVIGVLAAWLGFQLAGALLCGRLAGPLGRPAPPPHVQWTVLRCAGMPGRGRCQQA